MLKLLRFQKLVYLLTMTLLVALAFCSHGTAQEQIRGLEKATAAKAKAKEHLFGIEGVAAAGISRGQDNNAVVKVYTNERDVRGIPTEIDDVPVVVKYVGEIFAWDDTKPRKRKNPGGGGGGGLNAKSRHPRPVPIGVSVGTDTLSYCFAGTLGCRLKLVDVNSGNVVDRFILSNNHVFAEENAGVNGIDLIIQPGTLDNNCVLDRNDEIGVLYDYVPLKFNGPANFVDAAIALTSREEVGTATPPAGWGNPTSDSADASETEFVQKYGRTTALTEGVVDAFGVTITVTYDGGTARFENQIIIQGRRKRGKRYVNSPFSDSGDSGSLIVDANNKPVGLLFAGNSTITVANPIDAVLNAFSDSSAMMFVDDGNE